MKCRYCMSEIPEAAVLCSNCRQYQEPWRNWLPYIGGAVAVLTLIGSLSGYLVTVWADLYSKYLAGDDVAILSFKSSGRQLYFNQSGRDVYVSHVELASDEGNLRQVSRPSLIAPTGTAASYDAGKIKDGEKPAAKTQILSFPRARDGVKRFYASRVEDRQRCVTFSFYSADDPALVTFSKIFEKEGLKLFEFPATAKVVYYNWRGTRLEKSFDARLLFSLVQDDYCKEWLGRLNVDGEKARSESTDSQWPDWQASAEPGNF